ncbi:hypothetical protein AAG570_000830 [Ranatra chinensis]|uniref:Uncharacterized protein n=1 Tax=Ranatra chinensis TaxID=642074 RepID=A0ABD0ZAV8_9HEMI
MSEGLQDIQSQKSGDAGDDGKRCYIDRSTASRFCEDRNILHLSAPYQCPRDTPIIINGVAVVGSVDRVSVAEVRGALDENKVKCGGLPVLWSVLPLRVLPYLPVGAVCLGGRVLCPPPRLATPRTPPQNSAQNPTFPLPFSSAVPSYAFPDEKTFPNNAPQENSPRIDSYFQSPDSQDIVGRGEYKYRGDYWWTFPRKQSILIANGRRPILPPDATFAGLKLWAQDDRPFAIKESPRKVTWKNGTEDLTLKALKSICGQVSRAPKLRVICPGGLSIIFYKLSVVTQIVCRDVYVYVVHAAGLSQIDGCIHGDKNAVNFESDGEIKSYRRLGDGPRWEAILENKGFANPPITGG